MATVDRAARASAREKSPPNKSRDAGRQARRVEAILDCRAAGAKIARIAGDLNLSAKVVSDALRLAREGGDPRALTDREAAKVAAMASRAACRVAVEDGKCPDNMAEAVEALADFVQAEGEKIADPCTVGADIDIRMLPTAAYVERLRDMAGRYRVVAPNVGAHFLHLADLFEHCDRQYPAFNIPTDFVTLEMTDRRFPRQAPLASLSSPTARCGEV